MKKILVFLVLFFSIFIFISCGSGNEKKNEIPDKDPSDTGTQDTETDDTDSGGTESQDDEDTAPDSDTPENPDSGPEEPEEPEKTDEGCRIFTVDESTFGSVYKNTYYGDVKDNILGDVTERDVFGIDLFQTFDGTSLPGTYDLGAGSNKSYLDCTECVRVWQDHDNKNKVKIFFQESGSLVIETVDQENEIKGTLTAKLIEVTVDPDTREAAPVPGGECIAIENWAFNSGVCIPDCAGKVCGSDGCGGTCGSGCGHDAACSSDGKQCLPFACLPLSFEQIKTRKNEFDASYYEAYAVDKTAGSTAVDDILTLHFYDEYGNYAETLSPGVIDLGSGLNADYNSCTECILFYEDASFDNEYESYQKLYFQQSGSLTFEEVRPGTFESKGHGSFRLVEVDEYEDFAPVQGGNCYEVSDFTWDTICTPQCNGKNCGPDGCGGECGNGCGIDESCNAEQTECIPYTGCEEISLGALQNNGVQIYPADQIYSYQYGYTPGTGNPEADDFLRLALYSQVTANHKYDLSETNLRSCDICFSVYEDGETMFFQQKGEITFSSFNSQTGVFDAEIKNMRLVEISLDEDFSSIPVPGGKCLEITDSTIKYSK